MAGISNIDDHWCHIRGTFLQIDFSSTLQEAGEGILIGSAWELLRVSLNTQLSVTTGFALQTLLHCFFWRRVCKR